MSLKSYDFFDITPPEQSHPAVQKSESYDFFNAPSPQNTWVKPEEPSTSEQLKNVPELFAREGRAAFHSLPSTTAEMARYLGGKLQQLGEEQAAEQGREISDDERAFTNKVVNYIPDLIKDLGQKFPKIFPTYQQARQQATKSLKEKGIELPEKGRGAIERGAEGAGKATTIAAFPGSALVKAAAIGTSALTEALDLSEGKKLVGNLTIPTIVSIIETILTKKYIPPAGVAEEVYNEGKRLGMTDAQLAPIMATEGQVQRHGALAAGHADTKAAFTNTGEVLGNVIEDMQNRPQNFTNLPNKVQNNLINKLQDIEDNIRGRTHTLAPREKDFADFITHTISDIQQNGSNPRQLIGTIRSINKIGGGKTELRRAMEPIYEALEAVDPVLAKDLRATNQLYARYLSNLKEINPTQFNAFVDAGELQQILGAVFSGSENTLRKSLLRFLGVNALRKISSKILTDPNAQSLVRNFGKAVRDGRTPSAVAVGHQFKEYVKKNLPEEYEEIDWDKLDL